MEDYFSYYKTLGTKVVFDNLNEISPFELQEKWDNSGILVGSFEDEIENVYISMDLDLELAKDLKPNSLIITHHPLIFSGIKRVNFDTYSTKILKELIDQLFDWQCLKLLRKCSSED